MFEVLFSLGLLPSCLVLINCFWCFERDDGWMVWSFWHLSHISVLVLVRVISCCLFRFWGRGYYLTLIINFFKFVRLRNRVSIILPCCFYYLVYGYFDVICWYNIYYWMRDCFGTLIRWLISHLVADNSYFGI